MHTNRSAKLFSYEINMLYGMHFNEMGMLSTLQVRFRSNMKVFVVLLLSLATLCLCEENVDADLKEMIKALKGIRGKRQIDIPIPITCDEEAQHRIEDNDDLIECLVLLYQFELGGREKSRETYRAFCSCGDDLYEAARVCHANSGYAEFLDGLCATNEGGTTCYNAVIDYTGSSDSACDNVSSNCSTSCETALDNDRDMLGCCSNSLSNSSFFAGRYDHFSDELWAACDLDTPGFCTGAFSTGGGTALVISHVLAAIGLLTAAVCSF